MKLLQGNTRTKVTEATEAERYWLDGYLTFEDKQKHFFKRKYGKGDGNLHMLNKRSNTFPSGLVGMVISAARDEGFTIDVHDDSSPVGKPNGNDLEWLYDYQYKAVERVIERRRGILHLPTAAGKTEIAIGLVLKIPCHWLFVVHRKDLMHQARKRYEKRTGWYGGLVGDGYFEPDPDRCFTAATFQTLAKGLARKDKRVIDLLADAEGLTVDESHVLPAAKFNRVAMKTRRAYWRVGLSGTPLARGDRRSVYAIAALGPVIYKLMPEVLIMEGVLARPIIRMVPLEQRSGAKTWQGAYSALVANSEDRNALAIDMARRAAKPAFVFVKHVEHGKLLTRALNRIGIRSEFQWGEKATPEREAAVQRLRFGDIDVIVCSVIFQEGIDIPELAAVVNAAGMKSAIAAVQRIGRGMRSDEGRKETFEVWDVKDEGNGFLVRHTRERMKAYRAEGHSVQIVSRNSLRTA